MIGHVIIWKSTSCKHRRPFDARATPPSHHGMALARVSLGSVTVRCGATTPPRRSRRPSVKSKRPASPRCSPGRTTTSCGFWRNTGTRGVQSSRSRSRPRSGAIPCRTSTPRRGSGCTFTESWATTFSRGETEHLAWALERMKSRGLAEGFAPQGEPSSRGERPGGFRSRAP